MTGQELSRLSPSVKLIALATLAVLLLTATLSVLQYRSLLELEDKSRVAVQENLRSSAQGLSHLAAEQLRRLAEQLLTGIDAAQLEQAGAEELERRLTEIKQSHPEVRLLFAASHCRCAKRRIAVIATPERSLTIKGLAFDNNREVKRLLEAFQRAVSLRTPGVSPRDALFEQSHYCCLIDSHGGMCHLETAVYLPLFLPADRQETGFAGLVVDPAYVREQLLPRAVTGLVGAEAGRKDGNALAVGVFEEHRSKLFATAAGQKEYETRIPFAPAFPRWELAIGYQNTTIKALAKDNFQKSLALMMSVMLLLVIGLLLILRATARELKLAQIKSAFVSNVSHELKTPLALIRLFAEMLELGMVGSQAKAQEYYRIINCESRRLTRLINNILDFASIEAGSKQYQFVQIQAAEIVAKVLASYEFQLLRSGFELKTEFQPGLPEVYADPDAIAQAVINLLNNAIKYSADIKQIEVRVYRQSEAVAIEVSDHGVGIPLSEQHRIFEKFYRVDQGPVRNTKGSGLGLALVKHIVEAHQGGVFLESAPGKGSRFTILLPAGAMEAAARNPNFDPNFDVEKEGVADSTHS